MSSPAFEVYVGTVAVLLIVAALVHLALRVAGRDGALARFVSRAPGVDLVLFIYTAVPQIAGPIHAGWAGLGAAVLGQITALLIWIAAHELLNRRRVGHGPRIHGTLSRLVGGWRNHFAVWWTAWAVPAFWVIRAAQVLVYPPLTWTVRLPKYRHAEWINLSRHKFEGLVGYDLIWCLYCDWMTGVWSLGSEMLRNVESFWCPIRFNDPAKCANCRVDFPDVDGGWVDADGSLGEVATLLESKYGPGVNAWFGHPVRLTVGKTDAPTAGEGDSPGGR